MNSVLYKNGFSFVERPVLQDSASAAKGGGRYLQAGPLHLRGSLWVIREIKYALWLSALAIS